MDTLVLKDSDLLYSRHGRLTELSSLSNCPSTSLSNPCLWKYEVTLWLTRVRVSWRP
jgi:hypothetical protein